LWEVAGTSHFDQYGLSTGLTDVGDRDGVAAWFDTMLHPTNQPTPAFTCNSPINTGPATFVLRAGISALDRWAAGGAPPPIAPRLQTTGGQPPYAVDANGNVLGGIRTPAVDAPVAKLSGFGQSGQQFCALFGTTVPFTQDQLASLYGSHGQFVSTWNQATQDAVKAGFVVKEDAQHLREVGAQSGIPN
jgi:Alpha/beta hydrolase domain